MVTGIETAGLALAVFPIVVSSLKSYADGARTIKDMWRCEITLKTLIRWLEMERCKFENTCTFLLEGMVSNSDLVLLMEIPGGPLWRADDFQERLEGRLRPATVPCFMEAVKELTSTLQILQDEFGPNGGEKSELTDRKPLKKQLKRIKLILSKAEYKEQLEKITKINSDLQILTQRNELVEQYKLTTEHYDDHVVHQRPGAVTESWRQKDVVWKGAFGMVFLQEETETGALRAVKRRMGISYMQCYGELREFIAVRNRPDLFVQFLGWYECRGYIHIAMEYISNGDLAQYLKVFALHAKSNAREITTQLLEGLSFLHAAHICHCGVGPKNILIASHDPLRVKLTGFTVSKYTNGTMLRTRCGSQNYIAPEILGLVPGNRRLYTNAGDLWSLGCVLYQLFTSEVPFTEKDSWESGSSEVVDERRERDGVIDMHLLLEYSSGRIGLPIEGLLQSGASPKVVDLARGLLIVDPSLRLTAAEALQHEWITTNYRKYKLGALVPSPGVVHTQSAWRTVKKVTQGVMGTVWLEEEDSTKDLRATKRLRMGAYNSRKMENEQELELLIALKEHPENFVQFFGWFEHSGYIFFAMEYVEGGDLEQFLETCGGEAKMEVGEITLQVLGGLAVLQEKGLDHYYFRPANVLVSCRWPVRVKLLLASFGSTETTTHSYMAPELLNILPPTITPQTVCTNAANMWALGCLIHRILTLQELFPVSDAISSGVDFTPASSLQKFCHGKMKLPIRRRQSSLINEKWACFLHEILVANPSSRKSAREALESKLIQTFKVINPYKWRATPLKDDIIAYRAHSKESMWKETERITGGGMGSVWLMRRLIAGRIVPGNQIVIKKLSQDFYINNKIDFTREIHTLIEVRDYIDLFVQFLGWYEDKSSIFLAMEYIEHGDLEDYLKIFGSNAKLNGQEISTQILEGLVFLHERHICHRDLKPQNVLVVSLVPIRVKLADFGLAKFTRDSGLRTKCGTEGYKAPELIDILPPRLRPRRNSQYTNAVDIWSLGCLVHKILTSEIPFIEKMEPSSITVCDSGDEHEQAEYQDRDLLKEFCWGKEIFPKDSLQRAGICQLGIDFVEKMLVPDPKLRISATEALKSPWLCCSASQQTELSPPDSQIIRNQLSNLGVQISQRTTDSLVMHMEGPFDAGTKRYLPSTMLKRVRELQHKASLAGFTLLLRILLNIRITYCPDSPMVATWTLHSSGSEGTSKPINTSYDGMTLLQAAAGSKNVGTVGLLLSTGHDVNEAPVGVGGRTALQAAAAAGNSEVVRLLISKGAVVNANACESDGRTALQAAAESGHAEIVKLLLENDADCNALQSREQGRTALQAAAESGHIEVLRTILAKGALINAEPCSVQGRTALQGAAGAGYLKVVNYLLDNGADVNAEPCEVEGRTALQAAAEKGHLEIIQLLMNRQAKVNARASPNSGRTSLQAAAAAGELAAVRLLLDNGATANAAPCDIDGRTALQAAAESGSLDVLTMLLQSGANVNTDPCDDYGRTALQAAAEGGHTEIAAKLLDNDADVNADPAAFSGRTALQAAAGGGYLEMVELLLDHDASIDAAPSGVNGRTALQAAAENGHLDIVRLLLERDADPNAQSSQEEGRTAVHAAAENGHLEVVMLLLEYNADPEFGEGIAEKDASKNGHEEVVQLLAKMRKGGEIIRSST